MLVMSLIFTGVALAVDEDFYLPGQSGPYSVGVMEYSDLSTGAAGLVWYPTTDSGPEYNYLYLGHAMPKTNELGHAIANANVAAGGPFPLIFEMVPEGGNPFFIAHQEHLASHGYVVVSPNWTRNTTIDTAITLASLNLMQAKNLTPGDPLHGKIDMNNVGIASGSQGGAVVLNLIADGLDGTKADPRIKSAIIYDGGDSSGRKVSTISADLMVIGGTANGIAVSNQLFKTATDVKVRYLVEIPNSHHFEVVAGGKVCEAVDDLREIALRDLGSLTEPLVNFGLPFPAILAPVYWNISFNGGPTISNICPTLGVDSPFLSTDLSPVDGINDFFVQLSPPVNTPAFVDSIRTPTTTAFWKVKLSHDGRYQPYITPGIFIGIDGATLRKAGGKALGN